MYIISRCVQTGWIPFSMKPKIVPPTTPTIVNIVRELLFRNCFHFDVGLDSVVAYEFDIFLLTNATVCALSSRGSD
jgi:hypothetical protein